MDERDPRLLVCSAVGETNALAAAAALAVAVSGSRGDGSADQPDRGTVMIDLRRSPRVLRGAVLASSGARSIEALLREHPGLLANARGRVCFAAPTGDPNEAERAELLSDLLGPGLGISYVVCVCEPADFRALIDLRVSRRRSVLLKATRGANRPLLALLAAELRAEAIPFKVWIPGIGPVGARRALAGLEPGGETGRRAARMATALKAVRGGHRPAPATPVAIRSQSAQALPAVLGISILIVALALILVALGGAATAKGRLQRGADLAAISAARSMRDDFDRLFVPAVLPNGVPNPAHLDRSEYLARARAAARVGAERNDLEPNLIDFAFPDGQSFAPLRVRVDIEAEVAIGGERELGGTAGPAQRTSASAEAEVTLDSAPGVSGPSATAEGGGYEGPLAYRQGEPMRPDVAIAFDRMAAAARSAGVSLTINSGYRSDAEQQRLWDANPDPRWVAPPGTSLHRCGTELDLGPPTAYGWLATNAGRFGFVQRYSWEPWHYGFDDGPAPCSAEGDRVAASGRGDGAGSGGGGLPSFVPEQFRTPLLAAASRYDVSAALLAAQLMAESNFNPNAVSSAGAQGIAQFMPATAASYGLRDPFDPVASINAQARMMSGLLGQFGRVELALAAYNAGPGAVAACDCVPPYPETQAYVARILALLDGAGQLAVPAPTLEVRLIA